MPTISRPVFILDFLRWCSSPPAHGVFSCDRMKIECLPPSLLLCDDALMSPLPVSGITVLYMINACRQTSPRTRPAIHHLRTPLSCPPLSPHLANKQLRSMTLTTTLPNYPLYPLICPPRRPANTFDPSFDTADLSRCFPVLASFGLFVRLSHLVRLSRLCELRVSSDAPQSSLLDTFLHEVPPYAGYPL